MKSFLSIFNYPGEETGDQAKSMTSSIWIYEIKDETEYIDWITHVLEPRTLSTLDNFNW